MKKCVGNQNNQGKEPLHPDEKTAHCSIINFFHSQITMLYNGSQKENSAKGNSAYPAASTAKSLPYYYNSIPHGAHGEQGEHREKNSQSSF
ncbi:MAG: hypothetical protein WA705_08960 [Candidatus Ozemobacteraceae bacterium]